MVIVVLLIGMMMIGIGQAALMVDGVRVFVLTMRIESLDGAIASFRDRYKALPGDSDDVGRMLGRPPARFWTADGFVSRAGNGHLDGRFFDRASPEGEQYMAWRDLRLAGFWPGDGELIGLAAMPDNPFGGVMGFSDANLGLRGVLCMTAVPGEAARTLDQRTDDGVMATGQTRARVREVDPEVRSVYPAPGEGDYRAEETYMVCVRLRSLP